MKENIVKFIGSACSIMVLKMKEDQHLFDERHWNEDDVNFAYFLSAPIVLDAYNFDASLKDSKWQDEDK